MGLANCKNKARLIQHLSDVIKDITFLWTLWCLLGLKAALPDGGKMTTIVLSFIFASSKKGEKGTKGSLGD